LLAHVVNSLLSFNNIGLLKIYIQFFVSLFLITACIVFIFFSQWILLNEWIYDYRITFLIKSRVCVCFWVCVYVFSIPRILFSSNIFSSIKNYFARFSCLHSLMETHHSTKDSLFPRKPKLISIFSYISMFESHGKVQHSKKFWK